MKPKQIHLILHDVFLSLNRGMTREELNGVSQSFGLKSEKIDQIVFNSYTGKINFPDAVEQIQAILEENDNA